MVREPLLTLADLSLVHISMASSEEAVQDHINNLVRNIREQAARSGRGCAQSSSGTS